MDLTETIEICCLIEATARKPGNVHPSADFVDLTYDDFVRAAEACAVPLAASREIGLGRAILNGVEATRNATASNVNLGIALLIAPLAAVPEAEPLNVGVTRILARTSIQDAADTYAAIRAAKPGGLGKAASQDVHDLPSITLRDAMALAAQRDRIAEQYASGFDGLLGRDRQWLIESWNGSHELQSSPGCIRAWDAPHYREGLVPWEMSIIDFQLRLLATTPDSLVIRKCGLDIGVELQQRAAAVVAADWPRNRRGWELFVQFDLWLRGDGHRRNPGTTADFVAATLFAAARDGLIAVPSRDDVLRHADLIRQSVGK